MNIIEAIEQDYKRDDIPEFGVGDTFKGIHQDQGRQQREESRCLKVSF